MRAAGWLLAASLGFLVPETVSAQLFFASRPDPAFTIGPLTIRARVTEDGDPMAVAVDVQWGLAVPASTRPDEIAQDLYLLWPGEVEGDSAADQRDPALAKYVEDRGFSVIGEGRLALHALSLTGGVDEPEPGGAPFVVFVLEDGALGLSPPATLVRIPWTPRLGDSNWLMRLSMRAHGLVKPSKATWAERLFVGSRYRLTLSYAEVRDRPLFPMYLVHRDRVMRLGDAPAEIVVSFDHADRVKISDVSPPTVIRRLSETEETTELVSLFLDRTESITPQQLTVQFGYFSKVQTWGLVLIPALFFALGQAIGPVLGRTALRLVNAGSARVRLGRWNDRPRPRQTGVILSRDVLEKIHPGETTREQVIRLCGAEMEQLEQFPGADRRTLVYRGRQLVPKTRRVFGWVSTVEHWEAERHEVRIELERDIVRDVQAEIRYYRLTAQEPE